MTLRFVVYKWPSLYGTPRAFRWRWSAVLYAFRMALNGYVYETLDRKTGAYK